MRRLEARIDGRDKRSEPRLPLPPRRTTRPASSSSSHVPVVLPRPKVSVEVCSSAPLAVEASRLVVVSLLVSPGIGDCEKVLLMSIMWMVI